MNLRVTFLLIYFEDLLQLTRTRQYVGNTFI